VRVGQLLTGDAREQVIDVAAGDGQRLAWLHAHGDVLADEVLESDGEPVHRLHVRLTPREWGRFRRL